MANKIVVDIASKILVTLAAGAGALMAKAATEKGIGTAIKKIAENKDAIKEAVETTAENVNPSEVVTEAMGTVEEVVEKAAEVAEEVSGA